VRSDKPDADDADPAPAGRRGHGRTVRYAIGTLCALGAIYASVINVQWTQVLQAFRSASLPWTVTAAMSSLLTLTLVTLRWGLLVDVDATARRWRVLWDSVVIGQAVNVLAPLRFGEGVRVAVTCRGLHAPVGRAMVGLALERAFDVAALATIVLVLILAGWMPAATAGLLHTAATVTVVTLAAVALFVKFLPAVMAWLRRQGIVPAAAAAWARTQEAAMRDGWTGITRRSRLAIIALLTALIPVTAAATNLLVLRGFGVPVPIVAALVLLVVLQIGTAVVSVPGNIGVFHYLVVVTLAAWGVPRPTALATAIVLHAVTLGPRVVLGALSMALTRGSFSSAWHAAR
jgi:glycosyltransferase 2 family protein